MKRQQLLKINPLRLLAPPDGSRARGRHLALVKASPGTGKTAILVQIALDKLLAGKRLVHVGIDEQLAHIRLWYSQVFASLAHQVGITAPEQLENEVMGHRLLMTFMADNFSPARLAERLDGLARHQIPLPDCLIIDGNTAPIVADSALLAQLQEFAKEQGLTIWLACAEISAAGERQADTILALATSREGQTTLTVAKDASGYAEAGTTMTLDPHTLTLHR